MSRTARIQPIRKPQGRQSAKSGRQSDQSKFTVFLDRDGVFNVNPHVGIRFYRNLHWLPGAQQAFARLNRPDIQTSLATNQPWVGLLTATPGMMNRLHDRFRRELETHGGRLDNIEIAYGPPGPLHLLDFVGVRKGPGFRRLKPGSGMLEDAAKKFAAAGYPVDKARAVMVGDKLKDAQAAAGFGVPCILLATTYDSAKLEAMARVGGVPVQAIVPDLAAAVDAILETADSAGRRRAGGEIRGGQG